MAGTEIPNPGAPATVRSKSSSQVDLGAKTYAAESYWDQRYGSATPTTFDWFFSYKALMALITRFLGPCKAAPCLHVGCGNSTIQEGMARDGFASVLNVDISGVVIDQMRASQPHELSGSLAYGVVDCRDMHCYADAFFGSVLDKGTLDAVLCGPGGMADVHRYMAEVDRVLAPGGVFLLISLGAPAQRVNLLKGPPGAPWATTAMLLPKPSSYLASEASITGRIMGVVSSHAMGSKDDPVDLDGPYSMEEAQALVAQKPSGACGDREVRDYFFAYVCRKPEAKPTQVMPGEAVVAVPGGAAGTQPAESGGKGGAGRAEPPSGADTGMTQPVAAAPAQDEDAAMLDAPSSSMSSDTEPSGSSAQAAAKAGAAELSSCMVHRAGSARHPTSAHIAITDGSLAC